MTKVEVIGKINMPDVVNKRPKRISLIEYANELGLDARFTEDGLIFKNKSAWAFKCISWYDMHTVSLNSLMCEIYMEV